MSLEVALIGELNRAELTLVPHTIMRLQVNSQITFRGSFKVTLRTRMFLLFVNIFNVFLPVSTGARDIGALWTGIFVAWVVILLVEL